MTTNENSNGAGKENEEIKIPIHKYEGHKTNREMVLSSLFGMHFSMHRNEGENETNNFDLSFFGTEDVKDIKITTRTRTIEGTKHKKVVIENGNGMKIELTFFENGDEV